MPSDRLLVGTRKGLFTLRRAAGGAFRITRFEFPAEPVPMLVHDPRDGATYAALRHGHFGTKLHRADPGDETWAEIGVPTYPEKPDGLVDVDPFRKTDRPWKLEQLWELTPGGDDQPGRLWAGTIPGGLFRSDDRGATWELVRSLWDDERRMGWVGGGADLPGLHSVCVDPRNARVVTLAVSCGGVWRTRDDGATWELRARGMRAAYLPPDQADDQNTQDPHRVVQAPSNPDVFWCQHHNGIFRSTDDGASWHEITDVSPSSFGFAVAVHPRDADTAWFVPAEKDEVRIPVDGRVVVNRTRDGGKTFETLTDGLPQEHAYDLVFRHALAVDDSGDVLAFGSTTGALWITDNGGDSWQRVSAHLPPIYCVRFG